MANVKPARLPPGRGQFVSRRRGVALIQTAWLADDRPGRAGCVG
jgi:S-DNA-T family DNA segregation ATPase FtsK/SpoIIIE